MASFSIVVRASLTYVIYALLSSVSLSIVSGFLTARDLAFPTLVTKSKLVGIPDALLFTLREASLGALTSIVITCYITTLLVKLFITFVKAKFYLVFVCKTT